MKRRASMYILLLILLILVFWGWRQWRKGSWEIVSQIDSDSRVKFDQLLFLDELRGFAFSHSAPEAADTMPNVRDEIRAYDAWVYASIDGGLHWQTRQPLGNGYVVAAIKVPKGPIFLVQRFLGKDDEWHGSIRMSKDDGATWSKTDFGTDLVGSQFFDDARGFLWGNGPWETGHPTILYYTEDSAETWKRIDLPPDVRLQTYPPALHPDGSLFYLRESKLIHLIRQPDGSWREEMDELPSSLTGSMLYANTHSDNKSVWIIAKEPKTKPPHDIAQARLLRWDGPGKIETAPGLSFPKGYTIKAMFVYDSIVTIIGADYSGKSIFAPVTIFRSKDGGKSWESESPAIRGKAHPIAFYGRKIWAVGTDNRLQHRQ